MNNWLTDTSNLPNNDHAGFNGSIDPSMAFLQPSPNTIDPSQFQNQRYLNGNTRNASPAFQNPMYQVPSVVPSKRPRPPEDNLGASPRQPSGGVPSSRSQTPGQTPFPGYQPNGAQNFSQTPTPFQHLQHTPSNASPSPIMNQNFAQPGMPHRVGTASPSPFSPAGPHPGSQMSPHSDHGSRGPTPQNNTGAFMPGGPFGQAFNQQFAQPGMTAGGGQGSMLAQFNNMGQQLTPQQRSYQMQIQQQARQLQAQQAQGRPTSSGMMSNPASQMANSQMAAMRQQMQQNMQRPNNPQAFIRQLQAFMGSRGMPVDTNPMISGRPLDAVTLYGNVVKKGGFTRVTKANMWSSVAEDLGFPTMQYPTASQEIYAYFMRNMAPFEQAWAASRQKMQEANNMQQRNANDMSGIQNQMSPVKQMNNANNDHHTQFQKHPQNPSMMNQMPGMPNNLNQASMNGFATPPQLKNQSKQPPPFNQRSSSLSRQDQATPPNAQSAQFPGPSPMSAAKRLGSSGGKPLDSLDQESNMPIKQPIEDPFKPAVFQESNLHGPVNVDEIFDIGSELIDLKPTVPLFHELGVIDIHALTMSIKSGIHAEVRMALDALTVISVEQRMQLMLDHCDDLVETLIDCAQDQVDLLAEHAPEVSDEMLIPSYEDVIRGCRADAESLQDVPEFGSLEYDLDRAADRLICITTLLRNFSFYESNFQLLGMSEVVKFLSTVIRYLGTRNMLLRSNHNTLDFMKDVVVYLSNLSHSINLPGKEEALSLLHFLLSFAPCPPPAPSAEAKIMFTAYSPAIHKYMPSAVDSLAKLLARDDPNRTYYKSIFTADANSSPPYDLLTRTFALAVAPVPEQARGNIIATVESRKPFLLQGMLAAEILSSLAPGPEHALARSWLESSDGFALSLLRLVCMLSANRNAQAAQQQRHHPQNPRAPPQEPDANAYGAISHRGLAVLRTLGQKSKGSGTTIGEAINGSVVNGTKARMPFWVLPKKESVLGALLTMDIDPYVVDQLCGYAGLDD